MDIFTVRQGLAGLMLGKAMSPFCIPVAKNPKMYLFIYLFIYTIFKEVYCSL